jgi:hypothetical protein
MISKRVGSGLILALVVFLGVGFFWALHNKRPTNDKLNKEAVASSESTTLTSTADWDLGTKSNINSASDRMVISNPASGSKLDLDSLYDSSPGSFYIGTNQVDQSNATNILDSDIATYWNISNSGNSTCLIDPTSWSAWMIVDLGAAYSFNSVKFYRTIPNPHTTEIHIRFGSSYTDDGVTHCYDSFVTTGTTINTWGAYDGWATYPVTVSGARYLFVEVFDPDDPPVDNHRLKEVEFYLIGATATHTSAATQIDGSTTLTSWDSFTPSQTVPANTTLTYQFRSSADGATWPDGWSAAATYSGAPLDLSGITARRYFQVKSNFANSDGASTPTLSAYTINYTRDDTCDNFDHINLSPASASLETGGTTTFTATAVDSGDNPLTGITFNWSVTGGSISGGNYTAPATAGDYTVTVTSSCGGSAQATVHVTEPVTPPEYCVPPDYLQCADCFPHLTIIEPTKGSIHYTGDTLNISFTPKESCGGTLYHGEQIRYRVKLSLDNGSSYTTIAEDLHDINFPNETAWLAIMQSGNWYNLIQPTTYTYSIPDDESFITARAKIKVYMYRTDANPHSYSPSVEASSERFFIKNSGSEAKTEDEACKDYRVEFSEPSPLIMNNQEKDTYIFNLSELDREAWPTFSYQIKASLVSSRTGSIVRNIDPKNFVLNPDNLGIINPDGSIAIRGDNYPKAVNFRLAASDPECSLSAQLRFIYPSELLPYHPPPGKLLDVLVPDGGERWRLDHDYVIKWNLEGDIPNVVLYDIYLSLDSGESYPYTIAQNIKENGVRDYEYHIPSNESLLTDRAKIKVVGKDQTKRVIIVGSSEDDFTIYQPLLGAIEEVVEDNITLLLLLFMSATAATSFALLLSPLLSNQLTLSTIPEIFLGIVTKGRSKRTKWGQVYEATSGMPVPNAKLKLISSPDGRLVETAISNAEGYFGFVAPKGSFIIKVEKFGFTSITHSHSALGYIKENLTPSQDTLALRDNYLGEIINIEESDNIIKLNIPLISTEKQLHFSFVAKAFNLVQNFLIIINWPLLAFGTIISAVALYLDSSILNLLILALYIPLWFYEIYLIYEPKSFGSVEKIEDHEPIDLALVRVLDPESKKLIRSVASNQKGRYTLILPKGSYQQYAQKAGYTQSQEKSIYLTEGINAVHTNFGLREDRSL